MLRNFTLGLTLTSLFLLSCSNEKVSITKNKNGISSVSSAAPSTDTNPALIKIKGKASEYKPPTIQLSPRATTANISNNAARNLRKQKLKDREAFLWARDQLSIENFLPMGKLKDVPKVTKEVNRQKSISTKPHGNTASLIKNVRGFGPGGNYNEYFVSSPLNFSSDDYVDDMNYVFWGDFLAPSNADYIYLNFSSISMESPYDHIYVYGGDGTQCDALTGSFSNVTSVYCEGRYAEVDIQTDGSVSGFDGYTGFYINGYTYGVEIPNHPPVAIGYAGNSSLPDGAQFYMNGAQSYDPDSGDYITNWEWDFGDGTTYDSQNVYHTYGEPGVYNVSLTVWDTKGASSTDYFNVEVRQSPNPFNFASYGATGRSLSLSWVSGGADTSGYYLNWGIGFAPSLTCYGGDNQGSSTDTTIRNLEPNTQYTFALCSYNAYSRRSDSIHLFVTTPHITYPPIPINLNVTDLFANRLRLNWQSGGGNTESYIASIAQGTVAQPCTGTNFYSASKQFTGLIPETTYTMSVCALNSDGDYTGKATYQITTPEAPPVPPAVSNLVVSNILADRVTLNWDTGGGSTVGFVVAYAKSATAPNCNSGTKVNVTDPTATITGLSSNSLYSFTVCALNNIDVASDPVSIQATTLDPTPAPNPTGLVISGKTTDSMTLSWTSGGGVTQSFLVKSQAGTTAPSNCTGGTSIVASPITFSALGVFTNYSFRVCAVNKIGVPSSGITVSGKTLDNAPMDVSNLSAIEKTSSSFKLVWDYNGLNVGGNILIKGVTGQTPPTDCTGATALSLSDRSSTRTGLTANSYYSYRICTKNGDGISTSGVTITLRTLQTPPPNPTSPTALATQSSITLNWVSGGGVTASYLVAKSATATPANCFGGQSTALRTITFDSLNPFSTYYFRICSVNADGAPSSGITISKKTLDLAPVNATNFILTSRTSSSITLGWDYAGPNLGGGFIIKMATGTTAPSSCSAGTSLTLPTHSKQVTGLLSNTYYSFRLCSQNGDGSLSSGVTYSNRTLQAPPPNPNTLAATSTFNSISLSWKSGGGVTASYLISKSATSSPAAACADGEAVTGTSLVVTGLNEFKTYYFRICAVNADGAASQGATISKKTLANGLILTTASPSSVAFTTSSGVQITPSSRKVATGWGATSSSNSMILYQKLTSVVVVDTTIQTRGAKCNEGEIMLGKPAGSQTSNKCAALLPGYFLKNRNFIGFTWSRDTSGVCTDNQVIVGSNKISRGTTVSENGQSYTCSNTGGCGITYCATIGQ